MWCIVSVTSQSRFTPGNGPRRIHWMGGWMSSESIWTQRLEEKSSLLPPGIEPRSPGRRIRSQTLYWLSYPTPTSTPSHSLVSDYRLAGWSSIPGRGRGFFLYPLCPLWGPPSLLSNGYRGSFPEGKKRGQGGTLIAHSPHLVQRSIMIRSYLSYLPLRLHGGRGQLYLLLQDL
jgi:hypothetical protein